MTKIQRLLSIDINHIIEPSNQVIYHFGNKSFAINLPSVFNKWKLLNRTEELFTFVNQNTINRTIAVCFMLK